jgi:formylglycine-generating enzyme required for sulfatase activity
MTDAKSQDTKSQYETPEILHDAPLQETDKADFHFDKFAITLARLIADKKTSTPLTIGISGPWGSGKTTLLHCVQQMLDQTAIFTDAGKPALLEFVNPKENPQEQFRLCRTVWFNAWKYADEDELLVALVRVIVQTMAADKGLNKIISKALDPSYPRRDVVNTVLGWFSLKIGDAGFEFSTGEPQATPFGEKTAMLDLFDDAFDRLLAAWVHRKVDVKKIDPQEGVMVVFIDDLDRCLPGKLVQVLEAIKLFLDKPGCIFVLGADKSIIQQAVSKHYTDAGVTGESAKDYLEKVIQLRFELPPIVTDRMQTFLADQEVDGAMLERWQALVAAAEINPRRVKAVINNLNLQWTMALNADQSHGMDRDDFICWQALMHAAPSVFVRRVMAFDDIERRHSFVLDALRWVSGSADDKERLGGTFREYEGDEARRMRRVLKQIQSFGPDFTPDSLDAIIHLTAPPVVEEVATKAPGEADKTPARVRTDQPTRSVMESKEPSMVGGRHIAGLDWVEIPGGPFMMGSQADDEMANEDEKPQHTLELPAYRISRFPVSNAQFARFIEATQYQTLAEKEGGWNSQESGYAKGYDWRNPLGPDDSHEQKLDHPVVQVNWHDALAFCTWLMEQVQAEETNYLVRLPSEAQWEKAARGEYGNQYPWGAEWNPEYCNSTEGGPGGTTPVGQYSPAGDSPYGAADMVGNVWEWTYSLFEKYPYRPTDGREDENKSGLRVLRGGAFKFNRRYVRCAYRNYDFAPYDRNYFIGFRVVLLPISEI